MGSSGRLTCGKSHLARLVLLMALMIVAGCQTGNQRNIMPDDRESGYVNEVTRISRELDKPKYAGIVSAIDFHACDYPIRSTPSHKRFSDSLLDDYLDNFDKVGVLVRDGVVTPSMAYEELGFELQKAWCNNDVRAHVDHARKPGDQASPANGRFSAFEELAKYCLARDNKTCPDMDRMQFLPQE